MSNNNEYKKLRKVWYKKLAKSGFEDIESDDSNLKVWSSKFTHEKTVTSYKAKEEYYYMANSFLNSYSFETSLEKTIWTYHAEAISIRNIVKLLKKVKIKTNRQTVFLILKNLKNEMKKMYMPTYWENNEQF